MTVAKSRAEDISLQLTRTMDYDKKSSLQNNVHFVRCKHNETMVTRSKSLAFFRNHINVLNLTGKNNIPKEMLIQGEQCGNSNNG